MSNTAKMHILLTLDETAKLLEVGKSTLYTWRTQGKGPYYVSLTGSNHGRSVRYTLRDLVEFMRVYHKGMKKGW